MAVDYSTHFARQLIGEVLVEMGVVDAAGIEAGLEMQREKGGRLGEVLCFLDLIKKYNRVWFASDSLCQNATLAITNVTRRGTFQ